MMEARLKMLRYILLVWSGVMILIIKTAAIRCYTDLEATQVRSRPLLISQIEILPRSSSLKICP